MANIDILNRIYSARSDLLRSAPAAAAANADRLPDNPILQAVDYIKELRPLICEAYIYEYLAFYDKENPEAWADRLNTFLDAYKDDPDFAFLRQVTKDPETDQEIIKYKRVDAAKYEDFKLRQFSVWGATKAQELFSKIRNLVANNTEVLNTITSFPNEVFLHKDLNPKPGVGQVEQVGFDTNMEYLLGLPTSYLADVDSAAPQLFAADFLLFALFSAQTGWFTKDQATNTPFAFGGPSARYLRGALEDVVDAGDRSTGNYSTYFPYLAPSRVAVSQKIKDLLREQGMTLDEVNKRQTVQYIQATYNGSQVRVPGGTDSLNPAQDDYYDSDLNYISVQGTLDTYTLEQLSPRIDSGEFIRGPADPGPAPIRPVGKGFIRPSESLFYRIPNIQQASEESSFFRGVYSFNLKVIASIGSLYPNVTLDLFKEVLQDFVEEVQNNIDNAAAVGGVEEDQSTTPFIKQLKPSAAALKPVEHQCYLLENIRALAEYKDQQTQVYKYDHMGAIYNQGNGRQNLPGNLISYINHADKSDQVNALLQLCPEVYALLTPHIKIYRVDYKTENKLVPHEEQEIPFPNFIDPSDIEAIMNNDYGRFPGAGIKSFTWNLDGVNAAEVSNNISAQLNLHFQTIQDLFSLNQNLAAGQEKPGYLDLIIESAGTSERGTPPAPGAAPPRRDVSAECFEAEMLDYDPRDFEIKACVGWSTPGDFANIVNELEGFRDKGPDYGKQLEAALNDTRLALYLTLTSHELTFNENGSVDLTVNYQARLSGLGSSPAADIFAGGTSFKDDLKEVDEKLENLNEQIKRERETSNIPDGGEGEIIDSLLERKKSLLDKKIELVKQDKAVKYKRFLEKLYASNKIYSYKIGPDARQLLRDMSPEERAKVAQERVSSTEYMAGYNPQSDAGAVTKLFSRAANAIDSITGKGRTDDGQIAAEALMRVETIEQKYTNNSLTVPFMYLGDFIDAVLSYLDTIIDSDRSRGSLQLILAQVELLDPLLAYQVKELEIECPNNKAKRITKALTEIDPMRFRGLTGIKFTTGIGSLPISLEFFQEWFINNIVKSQVDNYSLLRFIKAICSSLIGNAFNSLCFEDGVNYSLRFDTSIFNFDRAYTGKIVTTEELAKSKGRADLKDCQRLTENIRPSVPTFVLYSVDSRPLTGNYDDDLATGIYHYYLGAACGLAKKINFERINIPFYREGRLQRRSELSALQLREMYNANIDMVGNNLHKNGQYIYINPIAIGAGSIRTQGSLPTLARLLGIGGYYMISKISHTVSSAGFDVNVRALQEGVDFSASGNSLAQLVPYSDGGLLNPKESGA